MGRNSKVMGCRECGAKVYRDDGLCPSHGKMADFLAENGEPYSVGQPSKREAAAMDAEWDLIGGRGYFELPGFGLDAFSLDDDY